MSITATPPASPVLFADRGCPFAHRVLALFCELGVTPELRLAAAREVPEGLAAYSPSGRIPFLVDGPVAIGESRVILEHLAEAYAFERAYPTDLSHRTRQRHAMAVFDGVVVPRLFREDGLDLPRLIECLDVLERAAAAPAAPSLFAFHVAPFWLRFQWWRPEGAVTRAVRRRPALASWLDAAAALGAVARTSPTDAERAAEVAMFQALIGGSTS